MRSIIGAPIPYGSSKVYSWRFPTITEKKKKKAKLCNLFCECLIPGTYFFINLWKDLDVNFFLFSCSVCRYPQFQLWPDTHISVLFLLSFLVITSFEVLNTVQRECYSQEEAGTDFSRMQGVKLLQQFIWS